MPTPTAVHRAVRWFAGTRTGAWVFARVLHRLDRTAFRVSGGRRTLTSILAGLPVVMLTTTGARTGRPHTVPVLGFPHRGEIVVVAGNFGRPDDPAWAVNLRGNPAAEVRLNGHAYQVSAEELAGPARDEAWQECLSIYPAGDAYAARAAGRTIGVFLLRDTGGR